MVPRWSVAGAIIITINVVHEVQNKYKHNRKAKRKAKKNIEKQKTRQLQRHSTHKCSMAAQTSYLLILLSDSTNSPSRAITNSRIISAQHWTL